MKRHVPWLGASALYVGLTIALTWPLVLRLPAVLPHDLGDPVLNTWIIWWNAHVLPLSARWWNAPMFWPATGALAFSETLLGLAPLTTPIQWFGGSATTAYNVAFLVTFPLSALATHVLVYRLSGRHDAGMIAGLVYGFHPYRVAHLPHLQVLTSYWMPVALLALHEFVRTRTSRWLWVFGAAWLMQSLSNGYFLLFFPVLLAAWLAWFALSRSTLRALAAIVAAWFVASLALVPLLLTYDRILAGHGFRRGIGEIDLYSADVTSFVNASAMLQFWSLQWFPRAEGELFPGLTACLLVLAVAAHWLRTSEGTRRVQRTTRLLLLGAVTFVGAALSAVIVGRWRIAIGGVTLVSVGVVHKPLAIGILLLVLAVVVERSRVEAWRRRSPLMFYVLAMGLMYLLCLGPQPRFLGERFLYAAPYSWLMSLPGFDALRAPARFAMLGALCLSVAAGLAFARLTGRAGGSTRHALAALVVAGVLADGWIGELPLPKLPTRLRTLESLPAGTAILELPLGSPFGDIEAMYRGIFHGRTVINGYSGHFPTSYAMLRERLDAGDPAVFDAITASGPVAVVVDQRKTDGARFARLLAARPGTMVLGEESSRRMFLLPGGSLPPDLQGRPRLPIQSAAASIHNEHIALALDGDPETGWDSGPQRGDETVTVDLGSQRTIDGLTMTVGEHLFASPRFLVIETSNDGREWSEQWKGRTLVHAYAGVVRHPLEVPLRFALPSATGRLLRLRQLGRDPAHGWTIVELTVFGH